jgi:hypothetical protein
VKLCIGDANRYWGYRVTAATQNIQLVLRGASDLGGSWNASLLTCLRVDCVNALSDDASGLRLINQLTSLQDLELQSNTCAQELCLPGLAVLQELRIHGWRRLECVDVRTNTQLRTLICSCNQQLTRLLLGDSHPHLHCLWCNNNQLVGGLDVRSCPVLRDLACEHNQLDSIDLANAAELRHLRAKDNPGLQHLGLAACSMLNDVVCSQCVALTEVTMPRQGGSLDIVDFSGCEQLRELDVSAQPQLRVLTVADGTRVTAAMVPTHPLVLELLARLEPM